MKIRNGYVSNSSSSSFIISGENNPKSVLEYARRQTYKAEVNAVVDWTLFNDYSSRPIKDRVKHAHESLNAIARDYNEKELGKNIKITTVGEMKRSNNQKSDFDIEEWYEGTIDKFADTDLVLYDTYDNYIPERACNKIIKKYKPIDYNTHMG